MNIEKQFKGEKYIYLLMAFNLAKEKGQLNRYLNKYFSDFWQDGAGQINRSKP